MGWDSNKKHKTTEFNSSLLRLISINQQIDDCNEYSRLCYVNGYNIEYLKLWRTTLKSLFREIKPKLNSQERSKIKKWFMMSVKIGPVLINKKTEEGSVRTINTDSFQKHWNLLDIIDSKLRILADKKGMLITNKELFELAIGEGDLG